MASAATSCARAAISAVGYVPSQILDFFLGSLISDTHFPHVLSLTPLNFGVDSSDSLSVVVVLLCLFRLVTAEELVVE